MSTQCPAGRYMARIEGHKLTESKQKGTPQLAFSLTILGRMDPADPERLTDDGAGLQRTIFRALTENTFQRVWSELDKLDFVGDEFSLLDEELSGDKFVSLAGKEIPVRMKPEVYQGQEQERWEFDMLGGFVPQSTSAAKAREVDTMFSRKRTQAGGAAAGAKPAAGPAKRANADVPF